MRPYNGQGDGDETTTNAGDIGTVGNTNTWGDMNDPNLGGSDSDNSSVTNRAVFRASPSDPTMGLESQPDMQDVDYGSVTAAPGGLMNDTSTSDDTDEIRSGIEQTRAEMSDTINAIQEKLNPQALMEQAKDTLQDATAGILDNARETVRDATVGRVEEMVSNAADTAKNTGSNVMDLIRQNPLPAAALGLGIGWLFSRNKGNSSGSHMNYQPQNYGRRGYSQDYSYSDAEQDSTSRNYGQSYSGSSGGSENIVEQVVNGIKENPMPSAVAGLGLGWWLMSRQGNTGSQRYSSMQSQQSHPSANRGYRSTYLSDYQSSRDTGTGDMGDQGIGDKVGQVAGQVGNKASDVVDKVGEVAGQIGDRAGYVAGNVANSTGDMGSQLMRTISENPIPAVLAGASIAWLFTRSNSTAQQTLQQAGNAVGNVASSAGEAVGNVASTAGGAVNTVASTAADTVGNVAGTVKDKGEQAQTQLQRMLLSNPLAVGAVATAIGVAVGLAIPETPQEHQMMGQARDNLLDKAQTVAQDTIQKVQQVTEEAGRTIQQEAQSQGLTQ